MKIKKSEIDGKIKPQISHLKGQYFDFSHFSLIFRKREPPLCTPKNTEIILYQLQCYDYRN